MKTNSSTYHTPVLLDECIDALSISPTGIYVDVTFGGGGHSKKIFEALHSTGRLIAFDQDAEAKKNTWKAPNFSFIPANFSFLSNHLKMIGIDSVDGVLADLGVSSFQFDEPERGFSIRSEARLDMRMNQKGELTAEKVVNDYSEDELLNVFKSYAEIPKTNRLVSAILSARENGRIKTTSELLTVAETLAPKHKEHKFFAQVFQAIRIEVNDEMGALKQLLLASAEVLKPGGRLVVMSYHSLEDRLVKNFLKRGSFSGEIKKDFYGNVLKPFTEVERKPIVPSREEIDRNNRARSAKLRIAERDGE